jgi:hypothetical protein
LKFAEAIDSRKPSSISSHARLCLGSLNEEKVSRRLSERFGRCKTAESRVDSSIAAAATDVDDFLLQSPVMLETLNRGAQTAVFELDIRISNPPYIDVCQSLASETGLKSRNVEKRINAV